VISTAHPLPTAPVIESTNYRPWPSVLSEEIATLPSTVVEAVDRLLSILPDREKALIATLPRERMFHFQFILGLDIGYTFGLWGCNEGLLEDCLTWSSREFEDPDWEPWLYGTAHPDDASRTILEVLWDRLQD
jgi:hypothetical protein